MNFESIKCPNCLKKLRPPFEVCSYHHLVCSICQRHLDATTGIPAANHNCIGNIFEIPVLNIMFNDITDDCQFGCGLHKNLIELKIHENICRISNITCKITSCDWIGDLSKLIKHYSVWHPKQLKHLKGEKVSISFGNSELLLTQFDITSLSNEIYWIKLRKDLGRTVITVKHLGSVGNCETDRKLKEYSIRSSELMKPLITSDISNETDITSLKEDKYVIEFIKTAITIPESVLSSLECVICFETMFAPIKNCENGHSFCARCCNNMSKCPTCRRSITESRNFALEMLGEAFGVRCSNYVNGCNMILNENELEDHQRSCADQITACVVWTCDWNGKYSEISEHWTEKHADRIIYNNELHICPKFTKLYTVLGNNFVLTAYFDEDCWCISLHQITLKENYYFKFDVTFSSTENKHFIGFSGDCIASTVDKFNNIEYLIESGQKFKLPRKWFDETIRDSNENFRKCVLIHPVH